VTVQGFKKCCMSSGMDDMLWTGSEEYGNVKR
jgi:hypothetical protein